MTPTTYLDFPGVSGQPRVKMVLPIPLRLGDKLRLSFKLKRMNGGRLEVLDVHGDFRVSASVCSVEHQYLSVESIGKDPTWRVLRKEPLLRRNRIPARFARTVVT